MDRVLLEARRTLGGSKRVHALEHGAPSRASATWSRAVATLAIAVSFALPACADSMLVKSDAGPGLDAMILGPSPSTLSPRPGLEPQLTTPAPAPRVSLRRTPSGEIAVVECPLTRPAGDCDRCPERACRQVRVPGRPDDPTAWAMFCDAGDVLEEARIACLCAGADARRCELSARETVVALDLIDRVFGGNVPPVGTRYRDGYGLRAVVDHAMHEWLASVAGPAPVLRCSEPDREAAARAYEERAQRVRITGSCDAIDE